MKYDAFFQPMLPGRDTARPIVDAAGLQRELVQHRESTAPSGCSRPFAADIQAVAGHVHAVDIRAQAVDIRDASSLKIDRCDDEQIGVRLLRREIGRDHAIARGGPLASRVRRLRERRHQIACARAANTALVGFLCIKRVGRQRQARQTRSIAVDQIQRIDRSCGLRAASRRARSSTPAIRCGGRARPAAAPSCDRAAPPATKLWLPAEPCLDSSDSPPRGIGALRVLHLIEHGGSSARPSSSNSLTTSIRADAGFVGRS